VTSLRTITALHQCAHKLRQDSSSCLRSFKIRRHDFPSIPFVRREDDRAALALDQIGDGEVLLLEGLCRIERHDHAVGEADRVQCALDRHFLERVAAARALLRRPAVSCSRIARPSAVQGAVIESRVSPASGPVSGAFFAQDQLNRLDLPTFGRPTMARRSGLFARSPLSSSASVLRERRERFFDLVHPEIVLGRHGECFSKAEAVSVATAISPTRPSHLLVARMTAFPNGAAFRRDIPSAPPGHPARRRSDRHTRIAMASVRPVMRLRETAFITDFETGGIDQPEGDRSERDLDIAPSRA